MKLRYTERSWAIDLISEINRLTQSPTGPIQKAGGEWSLPSGSVYLFPDVILFGDRVSGITLQGWELKMPDTPVTDQDLIDFLFGSVYKLVVWLKVAAK